MDQTAPLTPVDCDLRAFRDMPLDVHRFRSSDLVTEQDPEAVLAAILIWGAAWHEVPASSVPDNDRWLAKAAGYGRAVETWLRVRDGALRGFVRCSDGRLYNRTLAEKANAAWEARLKHNWQRAGDRHRKAQRDIPEERRTKFPEFEDWKTSRGTDISDGTDDLFRRNGQPIPADFPLKGREGKGREGTSAEPIGSAGVVAPEKKSEADPFTVPPEALQHLRDHRRKIKAAMTPRAEELIVMKLEKIWVSHGHDPTEVINQTILKGWRDVFPLKQESGNGRADWQSTGAGAGGGDGFSRAADRRLDRG